MGGGTLAAKVAEKITAARANTPQNNAPETPPIAQPDQTAQSDQPDQTDQSYLPDPESFDTAGESAYLGEQAALEANAPRARADEDEDDKDTPASGKELPPMDTLLARIPAETRETLETLFRARFVKVRKIPRKAIE